jgi:hypothetical protein
MKATIEFDITLDSKHTAKDNIEAVLSSVADKIFNQMQREAGCICEHPESDDIVKDINGNTVGTITVEADEEHDYTNAKQRRKAMKLEAAQYIADYSSDEVTVHEDYSGRGMYGETTVAISSENITRAVVTAVLSMAEAGDMEAIECVGQYLGYSTDSLGYDTIMY